MLNTLRATAAAIIVVMAASTAATAQDEQQPPPMMDHEMSQGMGSGMDQDMGGSGGPMMGGGKGMMGQGMQGMMGQGMGPGMMMSRASMMEGRLAAIKAELAITEAQASAWDDYAKAVKSRGDSMKDMQAMMMKTMRSGTALERIDARTKHMEAMLQSIKTMRPAVEALYKVLSDEQKKKADMLLGMGMM